jgi:hypothetical protein
MNAPSNDYGLWVILNSVIFVGFAYTFFKPATFRGLAQLRRVLGVRRPLVRGDVRLPADHLPAFGLGWARSSQGSTSSATMPGTSGGW